MSTFQQVTYQEAHDTEILAIDFTDPSDKESPYLVATAGRDRLLHVFDVLDDYALVQTLDDHSSSITCIRFTADGSRMMSCGADKSIVFRNCQKVMVQAISGRHSTIIFMTTCNSLSIPPPSSPFIMIYIRTKTGWHSIHTIKPLVAQLSMTWDYTILVRQSRLSQEIEDSTSLLWIQENLSSPSKPSPRWTIKRLR